MQAFRRFKADQSGTTAVVFGLSLIPLMGTVGAAVDYGRAASFHSQAQLAVDAASLALVREPSTLSAAQIQEKGEQYVRNALEHTNSNGRRGNAVASVTATRVGNTVTVSMSGTTNPVVLQAIGFKPMAIAASSAATWGSGVEKIELALVLDNTGSMDRTIGGKRRMDELQSAAKGLLKDLRKLANTADAVKVSLVPFDTEVRLDANVNRYKAWLSFEKPSDRQSWAGYVIDRFGTYAMSDLPATNDAGSKYPARQTEYNKDNKMGDISRASLQPVRGLTSLNSYADYSQLVSAVDGMSPRGYTNIALGTTWGLATLSPSEPFTEGSPKGTKGVKKYMIVLTDGDNTADHRDGAVNNAEWETNKSKKEKMVEAMDSRTLAACSAAKSDGVEVFTVKLLDGNDTMLRNCASGAANFFPVQNSGELSRVFEIIVNAISGTRITS